MNKKTNTILFLIIFLAAFFRLPGLSKFPVGFSADEAVQGYTAYSILKTGCDEWGQFLPLNPRSFGDYKPPLYTYLIIPSIALFDLNEFAVRLPSAIFGILAIGAVFLLTKALFGKNQIALLAAFFLAICPWHLVFSRAAIEANLTAFFFPMGFYFFLRGLKKTNYFILTALFWGLNLYTYHSARLFTLLFALVIFVWLWQEERIKVISKKIWLPLVTALFFIVPALISFFSGGGKRFGDVSLFSPTDRWQEVKQRQQESILKNPLSLIFNNKIVWIGDKFLKNYFSYFSFNFLFTDGSPDIYYSNLPGHGLLYLWELPLIFSAFWLFYKKKEKNIPFLLFWLFLAPLPAALSKEPSHANRAATFLPLWSILSAYGIFYLGQIFSKRISLMTKKIILSLAILILGFSFVFFLDEYFSHAPRKWANGLSYGYKEVLDYLKIVQDDYDKIVITKRFSEPQIFVAFYLKYDPREYQLASQDFLRYEQEGLTFLDQLGVYHLGKYEFRDLNWGADKNLKRTLIVGGWEDFTIEKVVPIKTIYYPNGKEVFLVIDTQNYKSQE